MDSTLDKRIAAMRGSLCDVYPLTNGWTVVAPKNWN